MNTYPIALREAELSLVLAAPGIDLAGLPAAQRARRADRNRQRFLDFCNANQLAGFDWLDRHRFQ
jgi:hypothetical protein